MGAAANYCLFIRSDGSAAWVATLLANWGTAARRIVCCLARVGTGNDWKTVAVYNQSLALKSDGPRGLGL